MHCEDYLCYLISEATLIAGRGRTKVERDVLEALAIEKAGAGHCVSPTFIYLHIMRDFIDPWRATGDRCTMLFDLRAVSSRNRFLNKCSVDSSTLVLCDSLFVFVFLRAAVNLL